MTGNQADPAAYHRRLDAAATAERAARALRAGPVYRERTEIARAVNRATATAHAIGMPLGMWCANGDYAQFSEQTRADAGARALAELDAALAELAAARERLAVAVTGEERHPAAPAD
ncbi:hypothetical protein [Nocardia carnea]|uniref:hypothetical protein n=1 Tax=Nocardia carnea TaxID=37328 RepID=UPI0024540D45|nr:hypothetical protein [Nocardia carnea]